MLYHSFMQKPHEMKRFENLGYEKYCYRYLIVGVLAFVKSQSPGVSKWLKYKAQTVK